MTKELSTISLNNRKVVHSLSSPNTYVCSRDNIEALLLGLSTIARTGSLARPAIHHEIIALDSGVGSSGSCDGLCATAYGIASDLD